MTAHEPLRPLTRHAISPPSNMIIPFSNSISPMETSLPVCPFRQGRFPFAGDLLRIFQAVSFAGKAAPHGTAAARRKYRRSAMPPLCKGRWHGALRRARGVADTGRSARTSVSIPQSAWRLPAPFDKGAKGRGTDVPEETITPPQTKQPSRFGRAAASLCFSSSICAHIRPCARAWERRAQSRGKNRRTYAPAVNPRP